MSDLDARSAIYEKARVLAMALVNEGEPRSALRAHPHGTCLRYEPAIDSLGLARRGDAAALRRLLKSAPDVLASITHAAALLHVAVLAGRGPVVELLLDNGVDVNKPSPIEPLVLLTPLCAARSKRRKAGAFVDRSGSWIGLSCTGNQGRRDDPEYVAALLRHGARADDRRTIGQGNDGGRATALHYATKAGFVKTIIVLLEHGADAAAEDDNGLTPLDWLERATKSVDRDAVRRLLRRPTRPRRARD